MTILALITLLASITLTSVGLYCWKRFQYTNFFFVSLFGIASVVISIWGYFHRGFVGLSLILITFYIAALCWTLWKRFQEKKFLHASILCLVMAFITIYGFYIVDIDLSLPIKEWSINSYFIVASLILAIIVLLLI